MLLNKTLRSSTLKLAFVYVAGFSSAIFILLGYVYWSTTSYISEKLDQSIQEERHLLDQTYAKAGSAGLAELIDRRTNDRFFAEWFYLLTDGSLHYVAGNLKEWPASLDGDAGWGEFTTADERTGPKKQPRVRAAYDVLPGHGRLVVGRIVDDLGSFRKKIAIGFAWAAGLFLILATAAGVSTSRRSVARIEAINATSQRIVGSGLQDRIPVRGTGDEWDGLAQNLNSMLDRIEDLVEANRQVSDNVAHDLRTPLTRMRGRLERAYNRPLDAWEYHALIGDVITELDGVLRTFASLLRIAEIENRERKAGFRDLDLGAIAREVVELFDAVAEESAVALRLSAMGGVGVVGDRDLLFDAVSNLVDNAIKHGGRNGEITIGVTRNGNASTIFVADRGLGIPLDEREHVLRRFYRLERSRNSPGNGLGLSLVAAVANLHGARIAMLDNFPGIRIELHFPVRAQTAFATPEAGSRGPAKRK